MPVFRSGSSDNFWSRHPPRIATASLGIRKFGNHKSRLSPQRVRQPCPERTAAMACGLSEQRTTA
jgi:hypothetical protein